MLEGKYITTLDNSGRVRLPAKFRKSIEERYGKEVFITSLDSRHVLIFPLQEWRNMTYVADESALKNPTLRNFLIRINRLGMRREIDKWGRILINQELRDKVNLQGKIIIEGVETHLVLRKVLSKD